MAAAPDSFSAPDSIYAQVDNYPWDTDAEFQSGLGAILGSTASSEQAVELALRARCFYYSRKFNTAVDFDAYKAYRANVPSPSAVPTTAPNGLNPVDLLPATPSPSQTPPPPPPHGGGATSSSASASAPPTSAPATTTTSAAEGQQQEAPYPTSFAHIVELITTGQPIPGIKEIPDTVLEGQGTAPAASKRKKPWEKDVGVAAGPAAAAASQ
ncbi:myb dna-binding domain protein [Diplodia corticola]|uniref:Myb dna-binding domain protein n=1 Tax=Diplodia corticola TaxID=236234 RepID=A0A1J9QM36_9PEZI|nr:myb dna-binding domain protein [Diplodia corticola]OJD29528.1 myb dna-binding domain protein [Diplodia corticola]